jgi:D-3-phosphoglycerate dehydrogenase
MASSAERSRHAADGAAAGLKILAVGDSYMPPEHFRDAFQSLETTHRVEYFQIDSERLFTPATDAERKLQEFEGTPAEIAERMAGVEVLVVHGAPVTAAVLDASPTLALVCCARGGPVNVDVDAVTTHGLPLVYTPGKNAEAVADLTLAFLIMLARGLRSAQHFLEEGGRLTDNFQGARFVGYELRRRVLGVVGYGQIGERVAGRAVAFGMSVLAYDPFVRLPAGGVEQVATLEELLGRAHFVSLHARATEDNRNLIDAEAFETMRSGAFLVNTARETLVDEDALDRALASGRLGGAAVDVVYPSGGSGPHRLLRHENVIMTPHVGGATQETLAQGAEMIAAEIVRFAAGERLVNVINRATTAA